MAGFLRKKMIYSMLLVVYTVVRKAIYRLSEYTEKAPQCSWDGYSEILNVMLTI